MLHSIIEDDGGAGIGFILSEWDFYRRGALILPVMISNRDAVGQLVG